MQVSVLGVKQSQMDVLYQAPLNLPVSLPVNLPVYLQANLPVNHRPSAIQAATAWLLRQPNPN